jgi:hypothetical protein
MAAQVADREPDPPVLAVEAQQRLRDRQAHQLGSGQARGRPGCGFFTSMSSILTYSAVTRVSRSASTRASGLGVGLATPILDTLAASRHPDTPQRRQHDQ